MLTLQWKAMNQRKASPADFILLTKWFCRQPCIALAKNGDERFGNICPSVFFFVFFCALLLDHFDLLLILEQRMTIPWLVREKYVWHSLEPRMTILWQKLCVLRPPAAPFKAILIYVQNPWKRHVSLRSSISKPYIQSNSIWFWYARPKRNMSVLMILIIKENCCKGGCWWP